MALTDSIFKFSFPNTMLIFAWGLGKVKHKVEKVTEGWKVLYKEYLHDLYCLPNCTVW